MYECLNPLNWLARRYDLGKYALLKHVCAMPYTLVVSVNAVCLLPLDHLAKDLAPLCTLKSDTQQSADSHGAGLVLSARAPSSFPSNVDACMQDLST